MNKILTVHNTMINQSEFILEIDSSELLNEVKASGQMLVDSSGLSFVYLLENNDHYTYLKVPADFWSDLKEGHARKITVFVTNGKEKIHLTNFYEELTYLIDNIKGNSNYGEEMVRRVEAIFD